MEAFNPTTVFDGRETCRTVLDALDRLGVPDAEGQVAATIYAGEVLCPNGQTPGLVLIAAKATADCVIRYLRMPDSNTFRGRLTDGTPIHGGIGELEGASVDSEGNVQLSDGRKIRGVEFQPGVPYRHYDFTPLQRFLVYLAVKLLGAEDSCYRTVAEQLLPGVKWLDYSAAQGICILRVKKLLDQIQRISHLRVSKLEIETTLRLAGMHFPKRRPRSSNPSS